MSEERVLGDLLDVRLARFVLIHDVWVGFGAGSPVAAVYELSRAPRGGLTGKGYLSTAVADERLVDIAISAKLAARFLDAIAGARLVQGMYNPVQNHTDDYPQIEIAIQVGARRFGQSNGIALLFTENRRANFTSLGGFASAAGCSRSLTRR